MSERILVNRRYQLEMCPKKDPKFWWEYGPAHTSKLDAERFMDDIPKRDLRSHVVRIVVLETWKEVLA